MPRNNNNRPGDNDAKIKLVYFEADNVSGDLAGLVNAFANAIRVAPVQIMPHQPSPPQLENRRALTTDNEGATSTPLTDSENYNTDDTAAPAVPKRQPRERKAYQGKPDDTISWDGDGTPFVSYFKQKNPQETIKKYLVIASWFKRHGGKDAIDSNIIYNAYRKLGWAALADIGQPFQDGAKSRNGYFTSNGSGSYTITNIGLDRVDELGKAKPEEGV